MQKSNGLLWFLAGFIAIAGWIVSCILTVNLLVEFFANGLLWSIVGALVGVIFDSAKVASLIWYLKTRFIPALMLTLSIIVLSIIASVGTLQVSSEKSALKSPEYSEKKETLNFVDNQIKQKENLAKSQVKINQLTRSIKTQSEIDTLLIKREALNSELKEIQYSASGLSGAIFRAFSKIFEVDIFYIILIGNVFLALLLETVISAFVIINFEKKENDILIGQSQNNDNHQAVKRNSRLDTFRFEKLENSVNVDKISQDQVLRKLRFDFKKTGKSDEAILHFFDRGINSQAEIARLVKSVLKLKRLSRQYVDQVIKRDRPESRVEKVVS